MNLLLIGLMFVSVGDVIDETGNSKSDDKGTAISDGRKKKKKKKVRRQSSQYTCTGKIFV